MYFESEYGEPRLRGANFLGNATKVDITLSGLTGVPGNQYISIYDKATQSDIWTATIATPPTMARLETGYYDGAYSSDLYNPGPVLAWDIWGVFSYHCNTNTGWFAVDHIRYDGDDLAEIELRFEDHCLGDSARLRGKLRWARP